MDGYPRFRRRNFFIKRGFQGTFALGLSVVSFIGISANLLTAYFLIDRGLEGSLYKAHLKMETTSELVLPIILKLGLVTVPAVVVISLALGYYLLRRVETPLTRFAEAMRCLGAGDFTEKRGFEGISDMHGVFRKTADSLERRFSSIKAAAAGLEKGFERLSSLAAEESLPKDEVAASIRDISRKRAAAAAEISRFKV